MTNQEIFDKVVRHLLKQNKKSAKLSNKYDNENCMYRFFNESTILKCAFGCLIPDELYDERMEGHTVRELISRFPALNRHINLTEQQLDLCSSLQQIHDNLKVEQWNERLRNLGHHFNLNLSVFEEFEKFE